MMRQGIVAFVWPLPGQITGTWIVCSKACLSVQQHQSAISLALCEENPSQKANNATNISISWQRHVTPGNKMTIRLEISFANIFDW